VAVLLPVESGFGGPVVFEGVEVFEEEEPGRLLGVVQFAGAAGVLPEDIITCRPPDGWCRSRNAPCPIKSMWYCRPPDAVFSVEINT
jgi:hypothetical protein